MKIQLSIELDIPDVYGTEESERDWLLNDILRKDQELFLHSNEIGDVVGAVKVLTHGDFYEI